MLDSLNYIAQFDASNALAIAASQSEQLLYADYQLDFPRSAHINNIVLSGMGGSALAGSLVLSWLNEELPVPFLIDRDYSLPAYVSEQTLVIISSYSGNTEEDLEAIKKAEAKKAQIIVMTSGGQLQQIAQANGYPLILVPGGYQPRMAVLFEVNVLTRLFERLGLIKDKAAEFKAAHVHLQSALAHLVPQTPVENNPAKQIAREIAGKSIVIYGSSLLSSAAYKWKINFNENAKNVAFANQLPEFNHNEMLGWTGGPPQKLFAVIELQSSFDHPQIKKRFDISNRLLSGQMPKPVEVTAEGKTKLEQILWAVQLGDFVSLYLAVLNQVNPTPVKLIEKFKEELES